MERYLDATRSTLLFARKVILVEGPAELFLIPVLVKHVLKIDLDRYGISVVPIYGTHFDTYAKLFSAETLPKKCAIIADGDLRPSDALDEPEDEDEYDDLLVTTDLDNLDSEYVKVFRCKTTFERALAIPGLFKMLLATAEDINAVKMSATIKEAIEKYEPDIPREQKIKIGNEVASVTLATAKRLGKARFAQIASKYANKAEALPRYIRDALEWLIENDND